MNERDALEGFIYAIRCNEFVKIGWAQNPRKRLGTVQSNSPYKCEVIGIRAAQHWDEQELHEILKPYRIRQSEWYRYEGVILDVIKALRLVPLGPPLVKRLRWTPERRALSEAALFTSEEARRKLNGSGA